MRFTRASSHCAHTTVLGRQYGTEISLAGSVTFHFRRQRRAPPPPLLALANARTPEVSDTVKGP